MAGREAVDYEKLEEYLRALAYASRLELLYLLRFPKTSADIRLPTRQASPGLSGERWMSRQAVDEHLRRLSEVAIVSSREGPGGKREYFLNGPRLFQIIEEFRRVGTIFVAGSRGEGDTEVLDTSVAPRLAVGPQLVLAHGMFEGKSFPLAGAERFVVGRAPECAIRLDYDPFVSSENSEVVRTSTGYAIMDLPTSRNGTRVNWRDLKPGEKVPLEPGDIIGVGRSLLVFRPR